MLHTEIDHLVIVASALAAGSAYIKETLGVDTHPGGEHTGMGTHNCLVRLGEDVYLEVIAINPKAATPSRQPLFGLDRLDPQTLPKLLTWVTRCNDITAAVAASSFDHGKIVPMKRGTLEWQLTVPAGGILPADGIAPSFIQWNTDAHPAVSLPDVGCSLIRLEGFHPEARRIEQMLESVNFEGDFLVAPGAAPRLIAHVRTPKGDCQLGGQ